MNHNMKIMTCIILSTLSLSACVTGGVNYDPCSDPKIKGQWAAAGKCNPKPLISIRNGGVNVDQPGYVVLPKDETN